VLFSLPVQLKRVSRRHATELLKHLERNRCVTKNLSSSSNGILMYGFTHIVAIFFFASPKNQPIFPCLSYHKLTATVDSASAAKVGFMAL
jgi:hypothetical protein